MDKNASEALNFSNTKALIIEDNEFVRVMLRQHLNSFGFKDIREAIDGTAAITMLDNSPDIIICDINMTPLNGFGFLRYIRALDPPLSRTPIIFLTGDANADSVQQAIDLSVNAYLLKPVSAKNLKTKIITLLSQGQAAIKQTPDNL